MAMIIKVDPDREAETTILLTDAAFEGSVPAHEVTGPEPRPRTTSAKRGSG
jgi:hypothetical protein